MSTFPKHFDTIIVGTGLLNSILAAACSRIGKSVLHLDECSYYGNNDASFTFQQLIDWIKINHPHNRCLNSIPEEILDKSRLFCIDLAPKLLYSNGDMVDLLVKSNVARYHEFKNNIRILSLIDENEIHVLPCRRNEVFMSPLLSNLADKRRLMKFIEMCMKYETHEEAQPGGGDENQGIDNSVSELRDNGEKPIDEFLKEKGLKQTLREYLINSIAMVRQTDPTKEACKRIKKFMLAIERYGRSPFLFPLYGCGEFPQSFCRLSAVFGGVYCLNTHIKKASVTDEPSQGRFLLNFGEKEDHSVFSDILVIDNQDAIRFNLIEDSQDEQLLSCAILITRDSIVQSSNKEQEDDSSHSVSDLISFLRIPPKINHEGDSKSTIYLMELNSSALVCPKEMNIVYMWCRSTGSSSQLSGAEDDLRPTVERIFGNRKFPQTDNEPASSGISDCVLWEFYYHQRGRLLEECEGTHSVTNHRASMEQNGLFVTTSPFDDIDYSGIIRAAEKLFEKICPDQEFLPRAPDPDEIIHSA